MLDSDDSRERRKGVLLALVLALAYAWGFYFAFGDIGFYPGDEGYLWYGVWRTGLGEVPLRDFQSYDPGRYYWCATFAHVWGDGMLGLRASTTLFQCVGLFFGLLVAGRFARGPLRLAVCAFLLGLWMFPNHKLFGPSFAMMGTWFTVRMLELPSVRRCLAAGAFAGFAAWFGRNHALYLALGTGLALLFVLWKARPQGWPRHVLAWAGGGLLGGLPMWAMFALVPGFWAAFMRSNRIIAEHGTNLPYPWMWPWRIDWSLTGIEQVSEVALALVFLLPPIVLPLALFRACRAPRGSLAERAVPIGATCVALFYVHHVLVRSYPQHLAESLAPLLLLLLCWGMTRPRAVGIAGLSALGLASVLCVITTNPPVAIWWQSQTGGEALTELDAGGEELRLLERNARRLGRLMAFMNENVREGESLFIVPNRPSLYVLFRRKSPSWWIYFFWEATEEEQDDLIRELEEARTNWVLLVDRPIDLRSDLRFTSTHPKVSAYFSSEFERLPTTWLPLHHYLMERRFPW